MRPASDERELMKPALLLALAIACGSTPALSAQDPWNFTFSGSDLAPWAVQAADNGMSGAAIVDGQLQIWAGNNFEWIATNPGHGYWDVMEETSDTLVGQLGIYAPAGAVALEFDVQLEIYQLIDGQRVDVNPDESSLLDITVSYNWQLPDYIYEYEYEYLTLDVPGTTGRFTISLPGLDPNLPVTISINAMSDLYADGPAQGEPNTKQVWVRANVDNFAFSIPEPTTLVLLAVGGLVLLAKARRSSAA
jgi:hypothetical protein